jgi:hypothetical protein
MKRIVGVSVAAVVLAAAGLMARQGSGDGGGLSAGTLKALEFRNIGPTIHTGRIQDVAIDPKNPNIWYVASAFGGVWNIEIG